MLFYSCRQFRWLRPTRPPMANRAQTRTAPVVYHVQYKGRGRRWEQSLMDFNLTLFWLIKRNNRNIINLNSQFYSRKMDTSWSRTNNITITTLYIIHEQLSSFFFSPKSLFFCVPPPSKISHYKLRCCLVWPCRRSVCRCTLCQVVRMLQEKVLQHT